jgi:hypothetical protein
MTPEAAILQHMDNAIQSLSAINKILSAEPETLPGLRKYIVTVRASLRELLELASPETDENS